MDMKVKRKIMETEKNKRNKWTEEEIEIFKREFPFHGTDIPELLKRHTKCSIQYKAKQLGIRYKKLEWTKEEIEILKREYPLHGYNIPELLERHTKRSIQYKALKLGITATITVDGKVFSSIKEVACYYDTSYKRLRDSKRNNSIENIVKKPVKRIYGFTILTSQYDKNLHTCIYHGICLHCNQLLVGSYSVIQTHLDLHKDTKENKDEE